MWAHACVGACMCACSCVCVHACLCACAWWRGGDHIRPAHSRCLQAAPVAHPSRRAHRLCPTQQCSCLPLTRRKAPSLSFLSLPWPSTGPGTLVTGNTNSTELEGSSSRAPRCGRLSETVGADSPYLQLQGQGFLVQQPLILNQPVIFLLGFAFGF